ncbi:hypothetical protein LCGC14_1007510 [marine sediment metagenome]|uniref:Uncharacterized protein n=1 Tax=marine sediment metagenome TaxID=412755 RepID=A0A0F9R7F4_9ZZZZ
MFEDIVKRKSTGFDTKTQCPHCRTTNITLYIVQGVMNDKRKQEAHCRMCNKNWYIIHDRDMSSAYVQYI